MALNHQQYIQGWQAILASRQCVRVYQHQWQRKRTYYVFRTTRFDNWQCPGAEHMFKGKLSGRSWYFSTLVRWPRHGDGWHVTLSRTSHSCPPGVPLSHVPGNVVLSPCLYSVMEDCTIFYNSVASDHFPLLAGLKINGLPPWHRSGRLMKRKTSRIFTMWKKEAHGREVTELRCIDMEQWFPSHGRGPNEGHESVSEAAGGSWKKAIIIIISYYTGRFF